MKVLYLLNIPSPNRVDFFNEFGKLCELTVLFETESSTERDKSWKNYQFKNFQGIIMRGKRTSLDTAFCPSVIKYLKKGRFDCIFIANLASPTGLLAVAWLKIRHIPYIYEGDGGIAGKKTGMKARLKRFIISSAQLCFSTTNDFDKYCMVYGAEQERIRRYPFSSIFETDILKEVPSEKYKESLREELAIKESRMILSVGRIIHLKGFDVLLNAFAEINDPKWGLYIIGGKINKEFQKIISEKKIKNVYFLDFMLPAELRRYYEASDIFVLPTRYDPWGLVINEAMAAGLPVITTYACGAGSEMVEHGECGFLYEPEKTDSLKFNLNLLMHCDARRKEMGEKALGIAHEYTLEKMAEVHYRILEKGVGERTLFL